MNNNTTCSGPDAPQPPGVVDCSRPSIMLPHELVLNILYDWAQRSPAPGDRPGQKEDGK